MFPFLLACNTNSKRGGEQKQRNELDTGSVGLLNRYMSKLSMHVSDWSAIYQRDQ